MVTFLGLRLAYTEHEGLDLLQLDRPENRAHSRHNRATGAGPGAFGQGEKPSTVIVVHPALKGGRFRAFERKEQANRYDFTRIQVRV